VTHCIIFEPDPSCRSILEDALASLHWSVRIAHSPEDMVAALPGPWAVLLAIESGDPSALDLIREIRGANPLIVICALLDELSPQYDRQVIDAGASSLFAKPVAETEIVEALVAGFVSRRS
jgi:DNA-binding response OmpR family regulator